MENHKNFRVGDEVVVCDVKDMKNCCHGYNHDMDRFAGRVAKVTKAEYFGYSIDIDGGMYHWCDNTLLHPDMENPDFKVKTTDLFALLGFSS